MQVSVEDRETQEKIATGMLQYTVPDKDDKDKISEEDYKVAVASVVLGELKLWPDSVKEVIGKSHPNKDGFVKGVIHVIGAYMHIAKQNLDERLKTNRRRVELRTARLLGGINGEVTDLRRAFQKNKDQEVAKLEEEQQKALNVARSLIYKEFSGKRAEVLNRFPSGRYLEMLQEESKIKEAYEGALTTLDTDNDIVLHMIDDIVCSKGNWSSKKRRARRMAAVTSEDE